MNKKLILGIIIVMIGCGLLFQNVLRTFLGSSTFSTVQTSSTYNVSAISKVSVMSSSAALTVAPTPNDEIELILKKNGSNKATLEKYITVEQHDNEIQIQISGPKNLFFWIFNRRLTAEILIPQKIYDQFSLSSKSGNISLHDLQAELLNVTSSSGNIVLHEIESKQLGVKSSSGNIKVDNIIAANLTTRATSGNITLDQIDSELISLSASSGNVKLNSFTAEQIDASVTSGNVTAKHGSSAFNLKTTSGNIAIEADEISGDSKLTSSSGNVKLTLNKQPQSLYISHQKSSGSTNIKHDDFKRSSYNDRSKKVEGQFGDGDIKLEVITTSGNFKLD